MQSKWIALLTSVMLTSVFPFASLAEVSNLGNPPFFYQLPRDFRASCTRKDQPEEKAFFIWQVDAQQLLITGSEVLSDGGWLQVDENWNHTTKLFVSYQKLDAHVFQFGNQEIHAPELHRWWMTFETMFTDGRTRVSAFQLQVGEADAKYSGYVNVFMYGRENGVVFPYGSNIIYSPCEFSALPF